MDNAAKALLIAGGILLAIIILSLMVYMFSSLNAIGTAQDELKNAEHLAKWNAEWEAYNKRLLYGAEVYTVLNKAEQNNADFDNNKKDTVEVIVLENGKVKAEITEDGTVNNKDYVKNKETEIFKCTKMEASSETGKIKYIVFEYVE